MVHIIMCVCDKRDFFFYVDSYESCHWKEKMRFNFRIVILLVIVISGSMLFMNHVLMRLRHSSVVYQNYFRTISQHRFINKKHSLQLTVPHSESKKKDRSIYVHSHLKTAEVLPVIHVASSYTNNKDVIPRTVYYDRRFVDGIVQDVITILAEVDAKILKHNLLASCQLNDEYSAGIKVIPDPIMKWIQTHKKGYTHFFTIIYCLGLQRNAVIKGDGKVKVIYKSGSSGKYRSVDAENSLHIKSGTSSHANKSNSLVVCATMYGHPTRFDEWLRYQKTIGVDMVHVSAQVSFFVSMELYPFLTESLKNGFVKIEVWKQYLKENEIFYHSQSLVYQDCVMRYRHSFEYAMMIDYDDFFIPLMDKKDIHYYLKHFFASSNTASIRLPWIQYHCKPLNYSYASLVDGNITQILSGQDLDRRLESKSIHKLNAVEIVSIHSAYTTLPGYAIEKFSAVHLAYFAHIKPSRVKCKFGSHNT